LSEFIAVVQELQEEWSSWEASDVNAPDEDLAHLWFRGHADVEWELTPNIFRTKNGITVVDEGELYNEFVRRGHSLPGSSADGWHSYFMMQHHEVPCRLLDWTDSALIALYFALHKSQTDAAVWVLNNYRLTPVGSCSLR
jgi:hypothetical protein